MSEEEEKQAVQQKKDSTEKKEHYFICQLCGQIAYYNHSRMDHSKDCRNDCLKMTDSSTTNNLPAETQKKELVAACDNCAERFRYFSDAPEGTPCEICQCCKATFLYNPLSLAE